MGYFKETEIDKDYILLIDKLKKAREDKGITQYELAKSAGLTQPTVSDIEQNKKHAGFKTIMRIARALGEVIML